MNSLFESWSKTGQRSRTVLFLAAGGFFLALAFIIGISDNLPGILLVFAGVIALILAFVHNWKSTRKFVILALSSLVGIPVFAVLHNVMHYFSKESADLAFLSGFFSALDVISFLLSLFICPALLITGVVGAVVVHRKNKEAAGSNDAGT